MQRVFYILIPFIILLCGQLSGQETPVEKGMNAINENVLRAQLGFLASDWTEGRETGEKGEYLAADYIASMLQLYGVKPGGDYLRYRNLSAVSKGSGRSYFQNFSLLKVLPGDEQVFRVISQNGSGTRTTDFAFNVDFTVRPAYPSFETEAPVVFAGYGFKNDKLKFNDFSKTDLKGKFILRIAGTPAFARESLTPAELMNSIREGQTYARKMGALGILEFNPYAVVAGLPPEKDFMNMSSSEGRPSTGRPDARFTIPGVSMPEDLVRVTISARAAEELLKGTGVVPEEYMKRADSNLSYNVTALPEKSAYLKTSVNVSQVAVRNIIGLIEGENTEEVIVIGAHYDHMGMGNGYIWNGADDNASGSVGVMTLAKAIMETGQKPEKTIVIALWTAEEVGLLGSRYFVNNPTFPLKSLKLNLNFDMISRYISDDNPNGAVMTYTKSHEQFRVMTENNLKKYGIDLKLDYQASDNPPGGSDHRSFVGAGIPIMRFKPGHREEYHTPYDETATVDWDIMEKIVKISFANIWELANTKWQDIGLRIAD